MDVTRKNIITLITCKIAARVYFSVHRYIIFSTEKHLLIDCIQFNNDDNVPIP